MPAENIIATHDDVRNSGASPSPPSGMLPNLLAASQMTKTTKPEATSEKSQPVLCTTKSRPAEALVLRLSVLSAPQSDEGDGHGGGDAEDDLVDPGGRGLLVVHRWWLERRVQRVVGALGQFTHTSWTATRRGAVCLLTVTCHRCLDEATTVSKMGGRAQNEGVARRGRTAYASVNPHVCQWFPQVFDALSEMGHDDEGPRTGWFAAPRRMGQRLEPTSSGS